MPDTTITMDDGVRLAATLYLPGHGEPAPCLLEALPYRKDDVTASYADEYRRLCDEHGYAVCRVDLRGTGSSTGIAVDEYPAREQDDLVAVIAWLAAQPWCTGRVGMFGTSYSGFNAIQVAMRRPPALGAIVPIYATDDRYTDDVHYMGDVRRLLDLVDYPTYMVAMNALPPVPAVFGPGWREEWTRRLADTPPWLVRWTAEQADGPYWRHGSLRPAYGAIVAPTMLVGGWADGYRNNTLRTYAALAAAGTPARLLVGPWSHQSARSARPGPHLDLTAEMVRWFDRWLRDVHNGVDAEPPVVYFRRTFTPPAPDTAVLDGRWQAEPGWPSPRVRAEPHPLPPGEREHVARAGTGIAAWNSCAGALPWGQPTDQRFDDAASLRYDLPVQPPGLELLGYPALRLRLTADRPVATVSAKLCDVAPDGTSVLITRGLRGLGDLVRGEPVDVDVELEATSYAVAAGHTLRLSVTGMDWPNTLAPPQPVTLTVDGGQSTVYLPVATGTALPAPALPHLPPPPVEADPAVRWTVTDDVLRRQTVAETAYGGGYDVRCGQCVDRYTGRVGIDRDSWRQWASSAAEFTISWPEATVRTRAEVEFTADDTQFTLDVTLTAHEGDEEVSRRRWREAFPRRR